MTTTSAPTLPLETAPEVVLGLCHGHVSARALQVIAGLGVGDLGGEPHYANTLDVAMLAITGGRERTVDRYRALLEASGLDLAAVVPTATPLSLIEATIR